MDETVIKGGYMKMSRIVIDLVNAGYDVADLMCMTVSELHALHASEYPRERIVIITATANGGCTKRVA